jgi:hypothetical protein
MGKEEEEEEEEGGLEATGFVSVVLETATAMEREGGRNRKEGRKVLQLSLPESDTKNDGEGGREGGEENLKAELGAREDVI